MNWVSLLKYIGRNQARYLRNFMLSGSLITPSFNSATIDKDDVILAREWLKKRTHWYAKNFVSQYEDEFARWNGSNYAFAFMGGRGALSACIHALDLQAGDEVILPGYTCVVVPNAFHFAGIKTVYSDIELDTYGLDVSQIKNKITPKTRAILLQHLYGLVCRDYEAILALAKQYKLKVIEDCAHATGAQYQGQNVGNFGDCAFYSSEQSKVFTTIQGGMAVTNNDRIAQKLKEYYDKAPYPDTEWIDKQLHNVMINFFQFKHPHQWWFGALVNIRYMGKHLTSTSTEEEQGIRPAYYGRKMPAPIADLGLNQLRKIDRYNMLRRKTATHWDEWCEKHSYRKPVVIPGSTPVYLRYPVLVEPEKKQRKLWAVKELGVNLGVWFTSNTHPAHQVVEGCPNADQAVEQCINLPCLLD